MQNNDDKSNYSANGSLSYSGEVKEIIPEKKTYSSWKKTPKGLDFLKLDDEQKKILWIESIHWARHCKEKGKEAF